jgi:hypothetical protein
MDKTTEIEIVKADLAERGFSIKVSWSCGLIGSLMRTRADWTAHSH